MLEIQLNLMNNYGSYTPQVARPQDGELITLCRILDTLALNAGSEQNPVVSGALSGTTSATSSPITAYVVNTTDISTLSFSSVPSTSPAPTSGSQITIYGSVDGVKYLQTSYVPLTSGSTASVFAATSQTIGQINTVGLEYIAFAITTAISAGSVVITTVGANGVSNVMLDNPLPAGQNAIGYLSSPSAPFAGQVTTTGTAAAIGSGSLTTGVTITNTGSATVYLGASGVTTSTGYALIGGTSVSLVVANLSSIYAIGAGTLSYIGS